MAETDNDPHKVAESLAEAPLSEEMLNEVSGGGLSEGNYDLNFTFN